MSNKEACHLLHGERSVHERAIHAIGLQAEAAGVVLTEILRDGAQTLLAAAIKAGGTPPSGRTRSRGTPIAAAWRSSAATNQSGSFRRASGRFRSACPTG